MAAVLLLPVDVAAEVAVDDTAVDEAAEAPAWASGLEGAPVEVALGPATLEPVVTPFEAGISVMSPLSAVGALGSRALPIRKKNVEPW